MRGWAWLRALHKRTAATVGASTATALTATSSASRARGRFQSAAWSAVRTASIVTSDSHPLMVPRVRNFMEHELKLDEAARTKWIRHWVGEGLAALEGHLSRDKEVGKFVHGDAVTMADLCLVSHAAGAGFFQVNTTPYPTVKRIAETCMAMDAFARAHPLRQPGAPAS